MDPRDVLDTLIWAADAGQSAMNAVGDWGLSGKRATQYNSDVAADEAILEILVGEGFGVLSEETGRIHEDRALTAVVDPLDGSTNAHRGMPWYATSIAVVDDDGLLASLVVNHVSGDSFSAMRGAGAFCNEMPLVRAEAPHLNDAIVALSGLPTHNYGWGQFRCFGALALDLTGVARGTFDGYVDCSTDAHGVWDYLGALHVCRELDIPVVDALGRELVVLDYDVRRTPVAGLSQALLDELLAQRSTGSTNGQTG